MLRSVLVALLMSILVCGAGEPVAVTLHSADLGVGSVCLLPPRGQTPIAWATNLTLKAGSLLKASNDKTYLVVRVVSGVTTNSPTNLTSVVASDGILYRPVSATALNRKGLAVYNTSTGHVYAAFGQPAVASQGIYLAPNTGSLVLEDAPNSALFVVPTSTNLLVTAQDWP